MNQVTTEKTQSNERVISIQLDYFADLVRCAEKIDAVERMIDRSKFVSIEDIIAILDIEITKDGEEDAKL